MVTISVEESGLGGAVCPDEYTIPSGTDTAYASFCEMKGNISQDRLEK